VHIYIGISVGILSISFSGWFSSRAGDGGFLFLLCLNGCVEIGLAVNVVVVIVIDVEGNIVFDVVGNVVFDVVVLVDVDGNVVFDVVVLDVDGNVVFDFIFFVVNVIFDVVVNVDAAISSFFLKNFLNRIRFSSLVITHLGFIPTEMHLS
jgi:hypothetical protein